MLNSDHADYVYAPGNGGDGSDKDESIECDLNNKLGTALFSNNRFFSLASMHTRILKMAQFSGHASMVFYIVTPVEGLSADPQIVSEIYSNFLITDGDKSIRLYKMAGNLGENQRLALDFIIREVTL